MVAKHVVSVQLHQGSLTRHMRRHHLSWVPLPEAPPQYAKAEGTSVMEESCEAKARTSTEEPVCFEYICGVLLAYIKIVQGVRSSGMIDWMDAYFYFCL